MEDKRIQLRDHESGKIIVQFGASREFSITELEDGTFNLTISGFKGFDIEHLDNTKALKVNDYVVVHKNGRKGRVDKISWCDGELLVKMHDDRKLWGWYPREVIHCVIKSE